MHVCVCCLHSNTGVLSPDCVYCEGVSLRVCTQINQNQINCHMSLILCVLHVCHNITNVNVKCFSSFVRLSTMYYYYLVVKLGWGSAPAHKPARFFVQMCLLAVAVVVAY